MSNENELQTSLDLETLDVTETSHIISIGYCMFNILTGENAFQNEIIVSLDKEQPGRTKNIDTIVWWMKQSEEARRRITMQEATLDLPDALIMLAQDINAYKAYKVWGNSNMFDVSILENAYKGCGLHQPWNYWDPKDMRTIVYVAESLGFDKKSVVRVGEHHSAMDDAIYQAQVISAAYQHLAGL